jgi:hypothetical protein
VDTQRIIGQDKKGAAKKPLVPSDWLLIRRAADGTETQLAANVLSWDISSDGQICYTDGRRIFHLTADGTASAIADSDVVERIVVLS